MTAEDDTLPKIDRWRSVLLDVHKWSDHAEIKDLTDRLYSECGIDAFDKSGNRKPKRKAYDMLRILLLDLYVNWLKDPSLAIGMSMRKPDYKVKGSRYNQLFISDRIIDVEKSLETNDYVEKLQGYNDKTGAGQSYSTRIRHTSKLRAAFEKLTIDAYDISYHEKRETIILREKYEDETKSKKVRNLEYEDTDYTNTIRDQLTTYNNLLKRTFIDIPSLHDPIVKRLITKGKRAGQTQFISIGPDNKHVHRVFNGTEEDNWTKGGRFYGGWWLQIPRDMRKDIYLNDKPTVEVDYKALHPNFLLIEMGSDTSVIDPYDLESLILPEKVPDLEMQRAYVKSLILMAINADSASLAFAAFRNDAKKGEIARSLTNVQLQKLLDGFTDRFPELKDALNTGRALQLMNKDSIIANMVINHFTQKGIPVLCIHDSFIIQHDKQDELKQVLHNASVQVTGKGIEQDSKSNDKKIKTYVQGNIRGFEEGRTQYIKLPNKVAPTEQYILRKNKFSKWLSLQDD